MKKTTAKQRKRVARQREEAAALQRLGVQIVLAAARAVPSFRVESITIPSAILALELEGGLVLECPDDVK